MTNNNQAEQTHKKMVQTYRELCEQLEIDPFTLILMGFNSVEDLTAKLSLLVGMLTSTEMPTKADVANMGSTPAVGEDILKLMTDVQKYLRHIYVEDIAPHAERLAQGQQQQEMKFLPKQS